MIPHTLPPDQEGTLVHLVQQLSRPCAVLAPDRLPDRFGGLRSSIMVKQGRGGLSGIRVVLFDIYGTLFSSAAGDITTELPQGQQAQGSPAQGAANGRAEGFFRRAVLERHLARYPETPYPEVRVEEIWETYPDLPQGMRSTEFALRYELAHNPVTPMPGALECIRQLRQRGLELGLVSNAQFYTPLLFKAFFGAYPEDLGFTGEFIAYSYIHGRAKPAPELFQVVLEAVQEKGYRVDECLYVGNDMLNDVFGAQNVGMHAALFAGDRKSLRLREDNPLCRDLLPDLVLDSLADLPICLVKDP